MNKKIAILFIIFLITNSCVVQFIPDINEEQDFMVVEGLITDQKNSYQIKISRSNPIGSKNVFSPVHGCTVSVSDDLGNRYMLSEKKYGIYVSDSLVFQGVTGRKYVLHISSNNHFYESEPMEMKPVPPIDSAYADLEYNDSYSLGQVVPGYQVYLNTHDPLNLSRFYRWEFEETWEFRLPYMYPSIINRICWKSGYSNKIYIKNTSALKENRITRYPLNFITTETDRLKVKYSILLKQYSLNEDEYLYWEKLQKTTENVGGLYDMVPVSIQGNIHCIDNPEEKVLGFFSVSSVSSNRIFIKNKLIDFPDFYRKCPIDTVPAGQFIPNLGVFVFIIVRLNDWPPTFKTFYVLTDKKECIDCSLNGTNKMPDYWNLQGQQTILHSLFDEKRF
jgi:hypothetical protein